MRNLYQLRWLGMILMLAALWPTHLQAQDDTALEPVSGTYAITNVNIIQGPGRKVDMGTIVLKDGLIVSVGKNVSIPADAIRIKADSMYAYAGFIDGLSYTGVVKPKDENRERPKDPGNPEPEEAGITPGADVRNSLSANEKSIEEYRNLGFTIAHVVPYGGMLPGNGAIILLGGSSVDKMVLVSKSSFYSELARARRMYPGTIMGVMAKYRELYRQASLSNAYASTYASNRSGLERPKTDRVLEAFYPVINKQQTVLFKAEDLLEAQRVLVLKKDLGFNLMIAELKQGWDIVNSIKASNAKVFLSLDLPEAPKEDKKDDKKKKDDSDAEKAALEKRKAEFLAKHEGQASAFNKAGIKFGFSTMSAKSKDIQGNFRRMIAAGLSEDALLASLTTSPAELLGISDRVGTIDPGKIANIVISEKPYFDEKSKVRYVFVDGTMYKLEVKEKPKGDPNAKVELSGSWTLTVETPQGDDDSKVKFVREGSSYKGTVSGGRLPGSIECDEVTLEGNTLTFTYSMSFGSNTSKVEVSGTVEGNTFSGTITVGTFGSFPVEGVKDPQ